MKKFVIIAALALLISVLPGAAAAQTGGTLTLRHLETKAFPLIAGYLDARDSTGARIADMQASQLQVLEDGQSQPISQLRIIQPGLRVILVINPTESFNIHDANGISRFDYAKKAIMDWASSLPSDSITSLSLITPEGILQADEPADAWMAALEAIPVDFSESEVDGQTLSRALELAGQDGPEPGMSNVIWWLTATPSSETLSATPAWLSALNEGGIPLFIWQVDAASAFQSEAGQTLQNMAQSNGGSWSGFSGGEPFPSPENYFSPLRSIYFFQYRSGLQTAGSHQVQLQLDLDGATVLSQPLSFDLTIQPPIPVLVDPPTQIERRPSDQDRGQLAPFSQPIEIMVQFPDQFERNLVRTTLFVNDARVDENTSAPFTRFTWDLTGYDVSQQVILRAEVEDELGLVGSTIEYPIEVLVSNPPSGFRSFMQRGGTLLAVAVVLIGAAAFGLVMLLSGRLKPAGLQPPDRIGFGLRRRHRRRAPQTPDPLRDSPLMVSSETAPIAAEFSGLRAAPAYLQRLMVQTESDFMQIVPIDQEQILIGSAEDCSLRLQEESVSPRHARLTRVDPTFQVADLGSEAGTWINYAPVSSEGGTLRDGDLLHIGRVAFRFLLRPSAADSSDLA